MYKTNNLSNLFLFLAVQNLCIINATVSRNTNVKYDCKEGGVKIMNKENMGCVGSDGDNDNVLSSLLHKESRNLNEQYLQKKIDDVSGTPRRHNEEVIINMPTKESIIEKFNNALKDTMKMFENKYFIIKKKKDHHITSR